jgi:Spy/CpxP family protein refolding chaperone
MFAQAQPTQPAQPGANHKTFAARRTQMRQRLMQALNLTPAQKEQARTIFQGARQSAKPVRDQLRENRTAMAAAVKADNTQQIQQLAAKRGELVSQMATVRANAMAKFYQTLTPEQRAKADRIHQAIRQRMQQRAAQRHNG